MNVKPSIEQLATVAALVAPTLSPDDAVKRALQLFEAADRLLRADEIAGEKELAEAYALAANFDEWMPPRGRISIADALAWLVEHPAGKPFKTERMLLRALQKGKYAADIGNGVWATSSKLLAEFREARLRADRERKKTASKKNMGGSFDLQSGGTRNNTGKEASKSGKVRKLQGNERKSNETRRKRPK